MFALAGLENRIREPCQYLSGAERKVLRIPRELFLTAIRRGIRDQ